MDYINYATFVIALSLNIALYIFISRRYLLKNYNNHFQEKEDILLKQVADKEKLIKSYERTIYLGDQENLYLKDEIVELQHQLSVCNQEKAV